MVGVVEIDDGSPWMRERSHRFACLTTSTGGRLSFSGSVDGPEGCEDLRFCEMDHFLTTMDFPRADEIHEALGWGGGGMVLRDTRGPSSPGTTLATVAIAMCLPHDLLPDAHMASIAVSGRDGPSTAEIRIEAPCPLPTTGTSLCQVHRMPLWGWGDEPFGFASTLNLEAIDLCTEVERAMIEGDPSPEESRRLRDSVQWAVQDNSDPVFAAFRRRSAAEGLVQPWDATTTASQTLSRDRAAETLVRELLATRDGARAA